MTQALTTTVFGLRFDRQRAAAVLFVAASVLAEPYKQLMVGAPTFFTESR